MLKEIGRRALETTGDSCLVAEDFMDDGSRSGSEGILLNKF
jgi:hypothetical protein